MNEIQAKRNLCPNCSFSLNRPGTGRQITFSTSSRGTNSTPLIISKMRDIFWSACQRLDDSEKRNNRREKMNENRGRVRLLPVNLGTGVFLRIDGDVKEEVTVLLAKSLHYGLFAYLAQSIPSSICNPLRQPVYYSSLI